MTRTPATPKTPTAKKRTTKSGRGLNTPVHLIDDFGYLAPEGPIQTIDGVVKGLTVPPSITRYPDTLIKLTPKLFVCIAGTINKYPIGTPDHLFGEIVFDAFPSMHEHGILTHTTFDSVNLLTNGRVATHFTIKGDVRYLSRYTLTELYDLVNHTLTSHFQRHCGVSVLCIEMNSTKIFQLTDHAIRQHGETPLTQ